MSSMMSSLPPLPRVLILDFYDSYTNNLLALFSDYPDLLVHQRVLVIHQDQFSWEEFQSLILPSIDCVILSPGPGRPDNPADFGFASKLITSIDIPILGICLGQQGIATSLGGNIIHVKEIQHGQKSRIKHLGTGVFEGVTDGVEMVTYNSLGVDRASLPEELQVDAWKEDDESAIMGLSHKSKPIYGVQFHPESIHSSQGHLLIHNFLRKVLAYITPLKAESSCALTSSFNMLDYTIPTWLQAVSAVSPSSIASEKPSSITSIPPPTQPSLNGCSKRFKLRTHRFKQLGQHLPIEQVFDSLYHIRPSGLPTKPSRSSSSSALGEMWLDSSKVNDPNSFSYSYLSRPNHLLSYELRPERKLLLHTESNSAGIQLSIPPSSHVSGDASLFEALGALQKSLSARISLPDGSKAEDGPEWKAGWIGWFNYEMKAESLAGYHLPPALDRSLDERSGGQDAMFAYSSTVLALEHSTKEWILIGLSDQLNGAEADKGALHGLERSLIDHGVRFGVDDDEWDAEVKRVELGLSKSIGKEGDDRTGVCPSLRPFVSDQSGEEYVSLVEAARSAIHEGESYELTMTTQFRSSFLPSSGGSHPSTNENGHAPGQEIDEEASYRLYLLLRKSNPAPYSSFLRFPCLDTTVVSSSPERFLKITNSGQVEMKPIKGTVGRCLDDKEEDERRKNALEADRKEIAENLMIVDLIRADLLSICLPSSVKVPKLIRVETYDHVHTLVTTVVGQLNEGVGTVEALGRCFPPGSMTGAPKLRSVQILDELEGHAPRGIYSGALGYLSLDGAADFSVVIRTMIVQNDQIQIGAGGAITWLSNAQAEWDEVLVKVGSVTKGLPVTRTEPIIE
ncbi:Para-aminobenzoate (PABA) synthase ABZ1 [Phaffia rhodozyma]|uniref:aminodeoxychorismate synthase n=1 Tax=Phaffia rhodozyma TaxID=264483 RepID=A0A0F7SSB3_PHARH|nr:Para-aminobenzoate (PABA) synthase ABZ1 [Phaffia rhodozyma]